MANIATIKKRLEFRQAALDELYTAYTALAKGQVQSYTIGSRSLTKFDLTKLMEEIKELEKEIDILESQVSGRKPRKAIGVVPRDF